MVARSFRRLYEIVDRQPFSGPPENSREFIVAAAHAMVQGDWRKAKTFVASLILGLWFPMRRWCKRLSFGKFKKRFEIARRRRGKGETEGKRERGGEKGRLNVSPRRGTGSEREQASL